MENDPQKRIQEIYESFISSEALPHSNESGVTIMLTQKEYKDICNFFELFAYN